jgi:hypothetical protein
MGGLGLLRGRVWVFRGYVSEEMPRRYYPLFSKAGP